jgi:hypothetical protein
MQGLQMMGAADFEPADLSRVKPDRIVVKRASFSAGVLAPAPDDAQTCEPADGQRPASPDRSGRDANAGSDAPCSS